MDAYTGFAEVYDMFMDNIPYETWCEYLTGLLREQGVTEGLLLDLGCGTGTLTRAAWPGRGIRYDRCGSF